MQKRNIRIKRSGVQNGTSFLALVGRFFERVKIDPQSQCWEWQGMRIRANYGVFHIAKKPLRRIYAHRFSYEMHKEPIPRGLVIDHLCRNPGCVNPDHLEAVTTRENVVRGRAPKLLRAYINSLGEQGRRDRARAAGLASGKKKQSATHCSHGHEFSAGNTRFSKYGHRICRACEVRREAARPPRKYVPKIKSIYSKA